MFSLFTIEEPKFNRKKVNFLILKIQKSKDDKVVSEAKFELFKMMKKIVVKNVSNYIMLFRNSAVTDKAMESMEVESECYFILDKCAYNYQVKPKSCFYFYYNKSLTRSFYRMFSKEVRVKDRFQNFHGDEIIKSFSSGTNNQYDVDFLITFLDLTSLEIKVLKSKLRKEKKEDFLKKAKFITTTQYQNSIKKIKKELIIFQDDK